MPDQRLDLSAIRTISPKSVKIKIAIASSALALSAVALGTVATSSPSVHLVSALTPATSQASRRLTPRQVAWRMLHSFGWRFRQFPYLNRLWDAESSWNVYAENPYSGAYGIPQAVPGSKMGSAGADWRTSAATQIRWGLRYIKEIYGTPHGAWDHELADGWY